MGLYTNFLDTTANTPASMTFLSHSYIPSGWIPLTFTAWGTASTE